MVEGTELSLTEWALTIFEQAHKFLKGLITANVEPLHEQRIA
jgi:hypothetical protein